jgi:hypothetical protein
MVSVTALGTTYGKCSKKILLVGEIVIEWGRLVEYKLKHGHPPVNDKRAGFYRPGGVL